MLTPDDIVIVTTLAPRPLGRLEPALRSWIDRGYTIKSVNSDIEVPAVRDIIPGDLPIEVIEVPLKYGPYFDRPLVPVDSMAGYFASVLQQGQIGGYINSDIFLSDSDRLLALLAKDSWDLMIVQRGDIDGSFDHPQNLQIFDQGYDCFFFKGHIPQLLPASEFRIGAPFWDYWFPLAIMQMGMKVARVTLPVTLHIRHEGTWDQLTWHDTLVRLLESFPVLSPSYQNPGSAIDLLWKQSLSKKAEIFRLIQHMRMDPNATIAPNLDVWYQIESKLIRDALNDVIHKGSYLI